MSNSSKTTSHTQQANAMLAVLKAAGLRLTPQRSAICLALAGDTTHPTAQALHNRLRPQFASLSLATVYNTLQTLANAGLIQELGEAGDNTTHYDADPTPHVNVICTRCHRIDDYADRTLKGVAAKVGADLGYAIRGARVAYYGLCPDCQKALAAGERL